MDREHHRMHNIRVSIGSAINVADALVPLLVHEFAQDPQKKWRYIRISAAVTAIVGGVLRRERV